MVSASLITPTYNVEKFIAKTLESVRKQTIKPSEFELILLDDRSTDNTVKIIKKEIKGMRNVKFFSRRENKGAAITRNQAIQKSKGEYIILLDGDDLLEPDAVEATIDFMRANPHVQYSYSKHKRIDEKENFIYDRPGYHFSRKILSHLNFVGAIICFTREIHDKIKGYNPKILYAQDWDHILRASEILKKEQIKQNNNYLYLYRIHLNSISTTKNEERKKYVSKMLTTHFLKKGIDAEVFWSHMTKDKYNYFDWRVK